MVPHDPNLPSIDLYALIETDGTQALGDLLVLTGYVIQHNMLNDLMHALTSGKPWLIEGPRGGGKTALAEALAKACNLPCFYLQGMQGLELEDVLYRWDTEAQNQWVRQATIGGISLSDARAAQWSREYLILGEALGAFDAAAEQNIVPIFILDEADKLEERIEDMLLQLLGRGWAHIPRFGDVGLRNGGKWPISILLSNDMRHDLSAPLRSRCIYSWLEPPTPREEVHILHVRVPTASPKLLGAVVKVINCIRGMGGVIDKPGLRESIDLLQAFARRNLEIPTGELIDSHLCYLGKRRTDLANIRKGIARLELAVRTAHHDIDEWVSWAVNKSTSMWSKYEKA